MAGGTYELTNKKQPGVYINRKSEMKPVVAQAETGVVIYPMDLDWGKRNEFIEIASLKDCFDKLGHNVNDEKMRPIVEMFRGSNRTKGANKVKVFLPNVAVQTKASATIGNLTVEATCFGARGNDIAIIITPDVATEISEDVYAVFRVDVVIDGIITSSQTVGTYNGPDDYTEATIGDLQNTEFVKWIGEATDKLTATAGTNLTGGETSDMTEAEYATVLLKLENVAFNVLCCDKSSSTIKQAVSLFIERQCEDRGLYCQAVMVDDNPANYEGIIAIKNGLRLNDGYVLTPYKATWWYAGCTAGAKYNESLTHVQHPLAIGVTESYTSKERDELLSQGQIVFIEEFGIAMVMMDINAYRHYTPEKGDYFSSNRLLRVINDISNYCYFQYDIYYVGDYDNNEEGRGLLKGDICEYLEGMQTNNGIQNFEPDDVTVDEDPDDKKGVIMTIGIEGVDSIEKIYIELTAS